MITSIAQPQPQPQGSLTSPKVLIPVKWSILFSTILSTTVSVIAGVLLYLESVSILEQTIEETSFETTKTVRTQLSSSFSDIARLSEAGTRSIQGIEYPKFEEVVNAYVTFTYSYLKPYDGDMYGCGIRVRREYTPESPECTFWSSTNSSLYPLKCTPTDEDPTSYFRASTWYENKSTSSELYWRAAISYPGFLDTWVDGANYTVYSFPLGEYDQVQNESGHLPIDDTYYDNMDTLDYYFESDFTNNGVWSGPLYWSSPGSIRSSYMVYRRTQPLLGFPGYTVLQLGFLNFEPWWDVLSDYRDGLQYIVVINEQQNSILSHNFFNAPATMPYCDSRCSNCDAPIGDDCRLSLSYLGPTVHHAIRKSIHEKFDKAHLPATETTLQIRYGEYFAANDTEQLFPLHKFEREEYISLTSGDYFLRKTAIFQYNTVQGTPMHIDAIWLKPVSAYQDRMERALIQLIIFCVVILMMDVFLYVFDLIMIAGPLHQLARCMVDLEVLQVQAVLARMEKIYGALGVREVWKVIRGLDYALSSLEEYKAFIPANLLELDCEESGCIMPQLSTSRPTGPPSPLRVRAFELTVSTDGDQDKASTISSHGGIRMTSSKVMLGLAPQPRGCILTIKCNMDLASKDVEECFYHVISRLENIASETKGVFHGFTALCPESFLITYDMATRADQGSTRAIGAALRTRDKEFTQIPRFCNEKVSYAIETGKVRSGNMGTRTHRQFCAVGWLVDRMRVISDYSSAQCKALGRTLIVLGEGSSSLAFGNFHLDCLGILKIDGFSSVMTSVSGAVQITGDTNNEWMYQYQNSMDRTTTLLFDVLRRIAKASALDPSLSLENAVFQPPPENEEVSDMNRDIIQYLRDHVNNPSAIITTYNPRSFNGPGTIPELFVHSVK
eukprot:TRINITY_DN14779_c0_g1_i1.p1 TRINITY_DN14779_c0_g1~~TRINITY_DN14779_c0_g1_i1.p1  ORF type:complete len:897 (+),score=103.86 TRINITY_DN14779_c0_g1_i1:83-2773(+)